MKRTLGLLAAACLISVSAQLALADSKSLFEGNSACAKAHSQCLREGVDLSLAASPAEGAARLKANMDAISSCDEAARACYEAVKAPHEFIAD
jgi:hypothetical protein